MDAIWGEDGDSDTAWRDLREAEWAKLSSEFTNVGYREGISAGKEASVQEGFDAGFADVGVPLGRNLGILRGQSSALLSFLLATSLDMLGHEKEVMVQEARDIVSQLGNIRFSDIEPRDLEAEQHAQEHLHTEEQEVGVPEELGQARNMENIEDMMAGLSAGKQVDAPSRPTVEDVERLRTRLQALSFRLGFHVQQ